VVLLTEYRKSLKAIEVEELLDLVFFRPLAFIFVLAVYRTPLTPNAITVLATIVGVAAAISMGIGSGSALIIAALLLILYDVLDCSDGMLARLQHSGSRIGRILDGAADYIVTVAFYTGIGVGYASHSASPGIAWGLTVAAGLSNAIHSGLVDFYRNRFLDHLLNRTSILGDDLEEFRQEYQTLRKEKRRRGEQFILWLYLQYMTVQRIAVSRKSESMQGAKIPGDLYVKANKGLMRWWTFLGPTTELSLLILGCLLGRIEFFLWAIVVCGNVLAMTLKVLQDRSDRQLAAGRI
jgi:hypothetical protein